MGTRLDNLRRGDWVRWQERKRKVARVERVSDSLVAVSFYTDDDDYQLTTRPISASLRVPQDRASPREQSSGQPEG